MTRILTALRVVLLFCVCGSYLWRKRKQELIKVAGVRAQIEAEKKQ